MDHLAASGAAYAAMRPDDDRTRYEGCLMLSALPGAPTIAPRPGILERWARLIGQARSGGSSRRSARSAR